MEVYIGMISLFGFTYAPRQWAFCSGQIVAISQNTALFSLLGTAFGGDGRATFGYPDLRARAPVGSSEMGQAPGLRSLPRGEKLGAQSASLQVPNLPAHTHTAQVDPTKLKGDVQVSTQAAQERQAADGRYLASQATLGTQPDMYIDETDKGTTARLGGTSIAGDPGAISIGQTGDGQAFSIESPTQAINYSMAELGLFPPRN